MRTVLVIIWLAILSTGIIALFWRVEWVYNLPTSVPKSYADVYPGQRIDIASRVNLNNGRPVLLHFFNPDCPCSKFNLAHFKSLVKLYGRDVDFVVVPMSKKRHSAKEMQDLLELKLPILFDTSVAAICGVYSTPQAVIINADQILYFKGNYNKSRYCTDKKSNYVMMALDSLVHHKKNQIFDRYALKAYGCKIVGQQN